VVAYDSKDQARAPATIVISVEATPTPAPPSPAPTPTNPPTVQPTDPTPIPCTYGASFVADVTIPDNTVLPPGAEFVKIWRLRTSDGQKFGDRPFVLVKVPAPTPVPEPDPIAWSIELSALPSNGLEQNDAKIPSPVAFYCVPGGASETTKGDRDG